MGTYKPGRPAKYEPSKPSGDKPPAMPGEYKICDRNSNVKYIGETNNLGRRAGEHERSGKLGNSDSFEYKVADGRSTSHSRRVHEQEKIQQHDPPQNKTKGGEGRPPKK